MASSPGLAFKILRIWMHLRVCTYEFCADEEEDSELRVAREREESELRVVSLAIKKIV